MVLICWRTDDSFRKGPAMRVVITLIGGDDPKSSVKAMFSDDVMRTPQGLMGFVGHCRVFASLSCYESILLIYRSVVS